MGQIVSLIERIREPQALAPNPDFGEVIHIPDLRVRTRARRALSLNVAVIRFWVAYLNLLAAMLHHRYGA